MRIFVTGGTGLIGTRLVKRLQERGDSVMLLTRRATAVGDRFAGCTVIEGDPMAAGEWMDAITDCDAVVNLAGENVFGKRWNDDYKRLLRDSRVTTTENVVAALTRRPHTDAGAAKTLVNASAVGYYGPHGDEELDEDTPPGDDVLARICVAWEKSALTAVAAGVRVVLLRIGVVLAREGGALATMLTPFKLGVGGPVGSGKQWLPWVHATDVIGLALFALDNAAAHGPINVTSPNPATNRDFSKALGRALHRPAFMPLPAFAMRLRFGGVSEVILEGQRVLPKQALKLGYQFQFPDLDQALADILP